MGATTQIDKFSLSIKGQVFVTRYRFNYFNFIVFSHFPKHRHSIVTVHNGFFDLKIFLNNDSHGLFNLHEIFRCKWSFKGKIIKEPILYDWTYSNLGLGKQALHSLCHQMGTGMSEDLNPVFVALGNDRDFSISNHGVGGINQNSIYPTSQSSLGKSGAN